jgi:glycosyltransferase involved in cell wall biosynthesis
MFHILFYTDTPNYGGAERQMELLAIHLKPLGFEVSLACGKYSKLATQTDRLASIFHETFVLQTVHKHDPRHYSQLKRLLRDKKFDLLHLHLWNPGACRYAFFAGHHAGVPIVTTEHDPFELSGLKRLVQKHCLKRTDRIIAISAENLGQLSTIVDNPKERLFISHNGIELGPILDKPTTLANESLKTDLGLQPGSVTITCVAELHPRKGHKHLIEAFQRLQAEYPMLHLLLVGTGPLENELKSHYGSNQNIHFLGWRTDVTALLRISDLFVLSSLREAFGLSILEAMACGVPVVATTTGGAKDIVENGKSGLLVPPGDSTILAEAIRTLLNNPGQRADLAKNGLERVKTHFTAEKMAERTAHVYRSLLGN